MERQRTTHLALRHSIYWRYAIDSLRLFISAVTEGILFSHGSIETALSPDSNARRTETTRDGGRAVAEVSDTQDVAFLQVQTFHLADGDSAAQRGVSNLRGGSVVEGKLEVQRNALSTAAQANFNSTNKQGCGGRRSCLVWSVDVDAKLSSTNTAVIGVTFVAYKKNILTQCSIFRRKIADTNQLNQVSKGRRYWVDNRGGAVDPGSAKKRAVNQAGLLIGAR